MPESRASPRSRLIENVRRSITPKRHARAESATMLMYSTTQERQQSHSTSFRDLPNSAVRPTVEQIAMGLHVSRTPHLRHHSRSASHSTPPPSLKKPTLHTIHASASTSTVTTSASLHVTGSSSLSTSVSASPRLLQSGPLSALKSRMARLLPGERKRSASAPPSRVFVDSARSSAETLNGSTTHHPNPKTARKAVRFEPQS